MLPRIATCEDAEVDRSYELADLWAAMLHTVATGGYVETWFVSAPFVLFVTALLFVAAKRLATLAPELDHRLRDVDDLALVRDAIAKNVRWLAAYAIVWFVFVAYLGWLFANVGLRFETALGHVLALGLLPAPAIVWGRRFYRELRALDVADAPPVVRARYERWCTEWRAPRWRLSSPAEEAESGALAIAEHAGGALSEPKRQ